MISLRIWDQHPTIALRVRASHEEINVQEGHDWMHAFRVGNTAYEIALAEFKDPTIASLAGIAGLCHNADRILQKMLNLGRREVPEAKVEELVTMWLAGCLPQNGMVQTVVDAVLKHEKKNDEGGKDSSVCIALKDADRVVNMELDHIIRAGQHYHDLPVVDYKNWLSDPEATYRNPKSVLRDVMYVSEWADPTTDVCVRTRLGMELAKGRLITYNEFVASLHHQLEQAGILPYPFAY